MALMLFISHSVEYVCIIFLTAAVCLVLTCRHLLCMFQIHVAYFYKEYVIIVRNNMFCEHQRGDSFLIYFGC